MTLSKPPSLDGTTTSTTGLNEFLLVRPFGILSKKNAPSSTNYYFTPSDLINLSTQAVNSKIFEFETVIGQEEEAEDDGRLQVRPGSLNHIFGYLSSSASSFATISASSDALTTFRQDLKTINDPSVSLNFSISTLDYDQEANTLVSDYATGLQFANDLNLTVFTPLSAKESQHLSILNSVFSESESLGSVFLYDGLSYAKKSSKYFRKEVLSVDQSSELHQQLKSVSSEWSELSYVDRPKAALATLAKLTGFNYTPFQYFGAIDAKVVFVVYGSVESELLSHLVSGYESAGVIAVRTPIPFNVKEFVNVVPSTTEKLVIVGQALNDRSSSVLYSQIQTALFVNVITTEFTIEDFKYSTTQTWSSSTVDEIFSQFTTAIATIKSIVATDKKEFIVWSQDNSDIIEFAPRLAHTLSLQSSELAVQFESKFDYLKLGGIYQSQIRVGSDLSAGDVDSADVIYIDTHSVLSEFDVIKTVKQDGLILVRSEETASFNEQDVEAYVKEHIPSSFLKAAVANGNKLVLVNPKAIGEIPEIQGFAKLITVSVAFWSKAYPELDVNELVRKILVSLGSSLELLPAVLVTILEEKILPLAIKEVESLEKFIVAEEETGKVLPISPLQHSFGPSSVIRPTGEEIEGIDEEAPRNAKLELFKRLTFHDKYASTSALRPDLVPQTHSIKVKEIRRLTPETYDRNIIHIEFDISGAEGFKYGIGEALGVHGRNNEVEVKEFLTWYGLSGSELDQVVEFKNKENADLIELRTVYQIFVEILDIFGKPGKAFYESLAELATDSTEQAKLKNLASPDGAAELKKYQDEDFFTFADIIQRFPSAKPASIQDLIHSGLIPHLHRREYSISSSQNYNPTSLHLLIVVVEWKDSQSRRRFGQCSKYLSDLSVGDSVTVSLKPSMMKLPPLSTQPMIMAGLGTGLAPFKAMIEERLYQRDQLKLDVGEVYLYLGARHQREEYLYGELWEAYLKDGILTHLGAAFSRDQKEKVYIQDKIREDVVALSDLVVKKQGVFYLCGPTWPVPDITEVLEDIIDNEAKARGESVDKVRAVEDMKEESRYILEVY